MAISFDTSAQSVGSSASPQTFNYTMGSGTNKFLVLYARNASNATDVITGITYGGVPMTKVLSYVDTARTSFSYFWVLPAPASGLNAFSITYTGATLTYQYMVASYFGVTQSTAVDSTKTNSGNSTTMSLTFTTVADNCWLVGDSIDNVGGSTAGSNTTLRTQTGGETIWDSNGEQTPAGSHSLNASVGSTPWDFIGISISPFISTPNVNHMLIMFQ